MRALLCLALLTLCSCGESMHRQPVPLTSPPTPFWFEDNNLGVAGGMPADFKARFMQPCSWSQSRAAMNTFMVRTNSLRLPANGIDDSFLQEHFAPVLNGSGVALVLDVTEAVWLSHRLESTGLPIEQYLAKTRTLIERLEAAGITVAGLSLQSVLSKPLPGIAYSTATRIQDVVLFAEFVESFRPGMPIGIIDARPSKGKAYKGAYSALFTAMAEAGFALDHIILDVPYEVPTAGTLLSWQGAVEVQTFVQGLSPKFGLSLFSRTGGNDSAQSFHHNAKAALTAYRQAGGAPDFFVQLAFFPHPASSVPDNISTTFTSLRTFRELHKMDQTLQDLPPSQGSSF